jgi:hypothetical protein
MSELKNRKSQQIPENLLASSADVATTWQRFRIHNERGSGTQTRSPSPTFVFF